MNKPEFFECGCCSCYHSVDFYGDCRDDKNRFHLDELEEKYGTDGFILKPVDYQIMREVLLP